MSPREPDPTTPSPTAPPRNSPQIALAASLAGLVLAGGTAAVLAGGRPEAGPQPVAVSRTVPNPRAAVTGLTKGKVSWQKQLEVTARNGVLRSVTARSASGAVLKGAVGPDGSWHSDSSLVPSTTYALTATVVDEAGEERRLPLKVTTRKPSKTLHAVVSPGDGTVAGVGRPVVVSLDRPVTTKAARAAVERRLRVTSSPAVAGSWHWMSSQELHYRGPSYWKAGSRVTVRSDLRLLHLPGTTTWGEGLRTSSYKVGDALVSTVDARAHTMTVRRNGQVVRVMRASTGKPGYDTNNGVHLVLEKHAEYVMDSTTTGHPKGDPEYYREEVKHAVRISNSGTFTHGAPWSVKDQGVRNVSHGCVNLSPADAKWFYEVSKRGDVVDVVGSTVGPKLSDAGTSDWNMSFSAWRKGSALS